LSYLPSRIAVPGLRNADPTSLLVMIQDLMNRNISQLDGATLADLFALAELGDALPRHLHRDLDRMVRGRERDLKDLPDGQVLQDQLDQLHDVTPAHVPERLRAAVTALRTSKQLEGHTLEMIDALQATWDDVTPQPPTPGQTDTAQVERPAVPKRLRMPDEPSPRRHARAAGAQPAASAPTPAAKVDEGRANWIRQHVLERLEQRREQGLKESILLAAACHNSPYSDMQRSEVLAELRELRKQGSVKNSAGRWIRVQRLGW
jgi:hypothetical protein